MSSTLPGSKNFQKTKRGRPNRPLALHRNGQGMFIKKMKYNKETIFYLEMNSQFVWDPSIVSVTAKFAWKRKNHPIVPIAISALVKHSPMIRGAIQ